MRTARTMSTLHQVVFQVYTECRVR
eukprot:COSAG06_NODE_65781_length_256_cov_0.656051_1_plen_24_part_10